MRNDLASGRAESSSEREDFIAHKMKANAARLGAIEVKGFNGFADVPTQLIPRIALGEDAFGETFGGKPAVRLLRHFEDDLVHTLSLRHPS